MYFSVHLRNKRLNTVKNSIYKFDGPCIQTSETTQQEICFCRIVEKLRCLP